MTCSANLIYNFTSNRPHILSPLVQVLLWAELRGNSQGVIKIPAGALKRAASSQPSKVVRDSPSSASIDGGQQLGMLAVHDAVVAAIKKSEGSGIGVVGTFNTASSTGALG
jgi:LDH2 family malate/lactate/ureidoglycolate dehydrogenase